MTDLPATPHNSDSAAQRGAERDILDALRVQLQIRLEDIPPMEQRIELDGFEDGPTPVCVEVYAHLGRSKAGQRRKLMTDMCKLLLAEKLLGKRCRKILAVCDAEALRFLDGSWQGRFANEFDIERVVVPVSDETRQAIRDAQQRQFR